MKRLALIAALWCTQAFAYVGSFVPTLDRNVVTVEFIDTQAAGPACTALALQGGVLDVVLSPLMVQATACARWEPATVIAPISIGPGSIWALQLLATPDGLLGHEFLHTIKRDVHPHLLPFVESDGGVRPAHCSANRGLPGEQPRTDVRSTTERRAQPFRVPAADETTCVIFVDACSVQYTDFGALVRECVR